jgi:hypothetical protein
LKEKYEEEAFSQYKYKPPKDRDLVPHGNPFVFLSAVTRCYHPLKDFHYQRKNPLAVHPKWHKLGFLNTSTSDLQPLSFSVDVQHCTE